MTAITYGASTSQSIIPRRYKLAFGFGMGAALAFTTFTENPVKTQVITPAVKAVAPTVDIPNVAVPYLNQPTRQHKVVQSAMAWKGRHFKEGQSARCADFVRFVFNDVGLHLPITKAPLDGINDVANAPLLASSMAGNDVGDVIVDRTRGTGDVRNLRPGDIVFFTNTYGNFRRGTITHVGIWVGNGKMMDRSTRSAPVYHRAPPWPVAYAVRPHLYKNQ